MFSLMANTTKIPSPFKRASHPDGAIAFEAVFDLPDDGAGANRLVIRVEMNSETSVDCDLMVMSRTYKDTIIMHDEVPISSLGNILYGFARIRSVPVLEIL
jgi:hypothetical protein